MNMYVYIRASVDTAKVAVFKGAERVTMTSDSWAKRASITGIEGASGVINIDYNSDTHHQTAYQGLMSVLHYVKPFIEAGHNVTVFMNDQLVVDQLKGKSKAKNQKLRNLKALAYAVMRNIKGRVTLEAIDPDRITRAVTL